MTEHLGPISRSWSMFGGRMTERGRLHVEFHDRTVRAYGDDPVPVLVIEDPEGTHYGWIDSPEGDEWRAPRDYPVMIQPHEGMFNMQFAYGPQAEVERGRGTVVRLRVEDAG